MGAYYPPVLDDEDEELRRRGVPADFPGVVLPNPDDRNLSFDTDSGIEPTRLSDNAKLSLPRSGAAAKMDVSSPPMNQMGAPEMREASAGYPAVGSTSDLESHIHGPAYAPVETPKSPAQQRLETLTAQGAPAVQPLHGFKKFADTLGQVFAPAVEERLRYGPQREYQRERGEAEKDVAGETTAQTAPAAREEINAKPRLTEAQTNEANAKAEDLRTPKPDKQGQTPEEQTIHDLMTGENGGPRINPQTGTPYSYMDAYTAVKQAAQDTKPNEQTDKTVRIVNGVPHEILIDKKTGQDIRDLGQTKLPGESPDQKRSAAESVQVEREARAAVHKAEQDYNGALATVQMQRQLIRDAKGGNKEAVRIVPLEGALQITTSQGVHRINRTEVEQYGQAGNLYDRIVGKIGSGVSGKSIPDDVLSDMDAMTQELEQNAHQRYQREYDYNKQVVEGYGGKDFDKRVPMVHGGDTGGAGGGSNGGGETKPPKEADPGMKWQHRTANGKTEWRQVPAQ